MNTELKKKAITFFTDGAIAPDRIAESIAKHSTKKNIGAHEIFLGQVRADEINGKIVDAIEFSAYREMAENLIAGIREEIIVKHNLVCAHVLHSMGLVGAGEICLFVFVSSSHRAAAAEACKEMVERIKKEAPIFGKEIFVDGTFSWKINQL